MIQKWSGRSASAIARSLEAAIHEGRIGAGAPLPPVRELAASLGVSPATAAAAYRLLHGRGLVSADGRRGTRVRAHAQLHTRDALRSGAVPAGLVDLATGNPDPALLPPLGAGLRALDAGPTLYDDPTELRSLIAFARGEFAADGIPADAVVVTSGALDAIERILREHVRAGDRVAVEDPGYPAVLDLLSGSGFVPQPMAVDTEGVLPDALEGALRQRVKAVILTSRAQNPTGGSLTKRRAVDLQTVLRAHAAVLLIENDPLSAIAAVPLFTLVEGRPHWAVVRSTAKFLGPDLRLALVAGDATTIARVRGRQALGPRWVSRLLQRLVLSLWADPSSGRHLARAADVYAQRRQAIMGALAVEGIAVTASSGFNLWIPVHHEAAAVQRLADEGWAVAAGERFRIRSAPGIRVTTSALAPEQAARFAADVAAAIHPSSAALA